jgi:hypothetical protein
MALISSSACASAARGIFANAVARSLPSGNAGSSKGWHASVNIIAALSRSFKVRNRAFLYACIACPNKSCNSISSTSSASSFAVASRQWTKATNVAKRRAGRKPGNRCHLCRTGEACEGG